MNYSLLHINNTFIAYETTNKEKLKKTEKEKRNISRNCS